MLASTILSISSLSCSSVKFRWKRSLIARTVEEPREKHGSCDPRRRTRLELLINTRRIACSPPTAKRQGRSCFSNQTRILGRPHPSFQGTARLFNYIPLMNKYTKTHRHSAQVDVFSKVNMMNTGILRSEERKNPAKSNQEHDSHVLKWSFRPFAPLQKYL